MLLSLLWPIEKLRLWQPEWADLGINYNMMTSSNGNIFRVTGHLRYWLLVRGIRRSPANSSHKGQWHEALVFSLICARIYGWVNNVEAGDLRRHLAHYDVIVMNVLHLRWCRNKWPFENINTYLFIYYLFIYWFIYLCNTSDIIAFCLSFQSVIIPISPRRW